MNGTIRGRWDSMRPWSSSRTGSGSFNHRPCIAASFAACTASA